MGRLSDGSTADRLALAPPEEVAEGYTFEKVGQKYVLTDGTKVMEIYNVQGLAHAQGMLMAYMPKEKIVVEADLFTPPAQGAAGPAPRGAGRLHERGKVRAVQCADEIQSTGIVPHVCHSRSYDSIGGVAFKTQGAFLRHSWIHSASSAYAGFGVPRDA